MAAAAYCPRAAGGTPATITFGAAKPTAPGIDRPVRDPARGRDRRRLSHPVDTSEAPEGAATTQETSPRPAGNVEVVYHRFGYSAGLARIDEVPGQISSQECHHPRKRSVGSSTVWGWPARGPVGLRAASEFCVKPNGDSPTNPSGARTRDTAASHFAGPRTLAPPPALRTA